VLSIANRDYVFALQAVQKQQQEPFTSPVSYRLKSQQAALVSELALESGSGLFATR
jgi:hypothetical protein